MTGFQLSVISVFSCVRRTLSGVHVVSLPFETSQNCVGLLVSLILFVNLVSIYSALTQWLFNDLRRNCVSEARVRFVLDGV